MKRLNSIMTRRKENETTQGFMTRRRWVGTFTSRQLILVYTVIKLSLDLWLVNFRSLTCVRTKRSFFFSLQSCRYKCAYLRKSHQNDKIGFVFNLENHVVRFYLLFRRIICKAPSSCSTKRKSYDIYLATHHVTSNPINYGSHVLFLC